MESSESDSTSLAEEQEVVANVMDLDDAADWKHEEKLKDVMPPNRLVLYRGIMNNRRERFDFH